MSRGGDEVHPAGKELARVGGNRNDRPNQGPSIMERTLYIPRMSFSSASCFAAAFRGFGIDTRPFPPSDAVSLELGGRYTSGEECFPERITLGEALKLLIVERVPAEKLAFFMPSAPGPCRFGQYAPFLRKVLDSIGAEKAMIFSPSSGSGYDELGGRARGLQRAAWRGLLAADILRKALLIVRPYEAEPGTTDRVHAAAVERTCTVLSTPGRTEAEMLRHLREAVRISAREFLAIPRVHSDRLRIGIVGEIFCRMNTFSNEDLVRRLEDQGAEGWISDITEWVYYTNLEQRRKWIPYDGGRWSKRMLVAKIKDTLQRRDDHALAEPFRSLFTGREEPASVEHVLDLATPYLPAEGVYGEMVLNVGKASYFHEKGCDGVIDISPFTCMNGIVSEAIYPKLSRDHDGIPIRIFYFDGTQSHLDRDLGIFLELARTYRKRKPSIA